ncbi:MAG: RluA family pseudouridine synthase [Anaerohalosphaeraceae bacterium]|nr:RluA family pseudouridine synthase [Anaerohalosphaeraceae bacterium]
MEIEDEKNFQPAFSAEPVDNIDDADSELDGDESSQAERVNLSVGNNLKFRRLDKYLQGRFNQFSRTTIQKLIKEQGVTVNGNAVKQSFNLSSGDIIDVILPLSETKEILPEKIPLNIIYEDAHIIVLNKQADLIVHPARQYKNGTLVNGLMYYSEQLSTGSESFRPGIVHRLDRNTTGVLVVAKNDTAHWQLARQFERRQTKKFYLALVHGCPDLQADCINQPIGVHPRIREKCAVKYDGKEAVTFYEVLEKFRGYSLLKVDIRTGRTHQIRVHLSHIKNPIVADTMYGGRVVYPWQLEDRDSAPEEPIMARVALHARHLEITHPHTQELMQFEAPLPDDIEYFLRQLRKHRTPKNIRPSKAKRIKPEGF